MKKLSNPSISTGLVVLFSFLLIVLALFAEVFESRTPEIDLAQIYANPIPVAELQRLHKVTINNKYGNFEMVNSNTNGELSGPWQLISPQTQRIKADIISKIVENLNILRVRSIHRYEPINITSFSLDNPNLSLLLSTSKNKDYEIKLGLINPIDNSAYLSISSQDQIYQIDPLEIPLETYDLSQIVEARIFALNRNTIQSVEILENDISKLLILNQEGIWTDAQQVRLAGNKLEDFLNQIEDMKSSSILENISADQVKSFQDLFSKGAWKLKFTFNDKIHTYHLTEVKKSLPGIGLQFSGQYLFTTDEMKSFSIVKKDQLKFLQTTTRNLK